MKKKILVVDDSALMRRVICDIINSDNRFEVVDKATNGLEAFDLLTRNHYDAVVLDVNMPKMNGLQLLQELRKYKISAKIMMASTDTREGAQTTLDALELGAMDFIHKPENAFDCKEDTFKKEMLRILNALANSKAPIIESRVQEQQSRDRVQKVVEIVSRQSIKSKGKKLVAIASSTGGPKALQSVIPNLPKNLDAPVLIVQHMPKGFTATLAERLNTLSQVTVKEAEEGDVLKPGNVYLSQGGKHMNVVQSTLGVYSIHYSDEPSREGVKPCANYMYESLVNSTYDEIVCVVMTGMGADGTVGIRNLEEKKKVHVIAQNQETCVVYGMPKSVVNAGLSDITVPLDEIAQEIILNVGVH
ncbi:MAG: chemotaxis response regulator protein-glutamate methylesterase [Lachnospiraceae bacterium]|nr:chemotaxis response regulator protein-glutamate methylesterase [Lachnospiraceae bacterium]